MSNFYKTMAALGLTSVLFGACVSPPTQTQAPAADSSAQSAAPAEAGSNILRVRYPVDLTNADPAFHPGGIDTGTLSSVGEGLVTFKPGTWELVNVLAEEISSSEDGMQITFKLKEGIQFHKGYGELTAEDVRYSYERFIDEKVNASYKDDWKALDHVEVTDKYSGIIHLKEPFAPLWYSTLPVSGGIIVSQKAVEEMGLEKYGTNPVGTGPYEFVEWKPNDRVILKRNDAYWGEKAAFDEMHFVPIADDSAAEIAMEAGEIDFGDIPLDSIERFNANDQFEVLEFNSLGYNGIFINTQNPKLADVKVRQAIQLAVDVPSIIEGAYEGLHGRACALVSEGQIGYWADAPCPERDVEKAKALLGEAGVDALDLQIVMLEGEENKAVAEIIQANLAEIGVNLEIVPQDGGTYWDLASVKDRELTLFDWTTTNPDPYWLTLWFTCDQVEQWNWTNLCSEEFDKFNSEATITSDAAKRAELYIELQKAWDADVPIIWTVHPNFYRATRATIEPALSPNGIILPYAFTLK